MYLYKVNNSALGLPNSFINVILQALERTDHMSQLALPLQLYICGAKPLSEKVCCSIYTQTFFTSEDPLKKIAVLGTPSKTNSLAVSGSDSTYIGGQKMVTFVAV